MVEIKLDQNEFLKFLKSLQKQRFSTLESLKEYFYEETTIKPVFEQGEPHVDTGDFSFIDNCTVNGIDLCYIDLFYIFDNCNAILITDYTYDFP